MKNAEDNELEDMVSRTDITYSEVEYKLDVNYTAASCKRYTLSPGIHEFTDINLLIKSLIPDIVKVRITIDDIRLGSN